MRPMMQRPTRLIWPISPPRLSRLRPMKPTIPRPTKLTRPLWSISPPRLMWPISQQANEADKPTRLLRLIRPLILFRSTKGSMRLMSTMSQKTHNAKMRPRSRRLPTIQQSAKVNKPTSPTTPMKSTRRMKPTTPTTPMKSTRPSKLIGLLRRGRRGRQG